LLKNLFPILENHRTLLFILILVTVLIPLGLVKNISRLAFTSTLAIFGMIYLIALIAVESPMYYNNIIKRNSESENQFKIITNSNFTDNITESNTITNPKENITSALHFINIFDITKSFSNARFVVGLTNIIFALGIQFNTINVFGSFYRKNEKKSINPSEEKLDNFEFVFYNGERILKITMITVTILYLIIGVFGYISVPINTPILIFNRYDLYKPDILMILAKCVLCFALTFKIPVIFNGLKINIIRYLLKYSKKNENENIINDTNITLQQRDSLNTELTNIVVSVCFMMMSSILAISFPYIDHLITIMGGFCSVSISFIFPFMILYKDYYFKIIENEKNKCISENYNPHNISLSCNDKKNSSENNDNKLVIENNSENKYNYNLLWLALLDLVKNNLFEIILIMFFSIIGYSASIYIIINLF
jgi:amino acid permease